MKFNIKQENDQLVKFLFNGDKEVIVEETDEDVIRYICGLGIISSDSESARVYYHYVSDNQGSVRLILTDTVMTGRYAITIIMMHLVKAL